MKSILRIIVVLLFSMGVSCNKESTSNSEFPYEATVLGLNSDCGVHLIMFKGKLVDIYKIAGADSIWSVYNASNLPSEYQIEGLQIKLNIRKVDANDKIGPCVAYGPSFPWIHITKISKQ